MVDSGQDELRARTEPVAAAAPADRGNSAIDPQQLAKVAVIAVDLRDGFRNERRSPEYRAIHGLAADVDDTHEDWVRRLHPDDRAEAVRNFLDAVSGTAEQLPRVIGSSGRATGR